MNVTTPEEFVVTGPTLMFIGPSLIRTLAAVPGFPPELVLTVITTVPTGRLAVTVFPLPVTVWLVSVVLWPDLVATTW